jgi:hypothetical protein
MTERGISSRRLPHPAVLNLQAFQCLFPLSSCRGDVAISVSVGLISMFPETLSGLSIP